MSNLYTYDGSVWSEIGKNGIDGTNGTDGKEVEIQNNGTYIQWRYVGGTWTNIVALSALDGIDGKDVEMQVASGYIQWRLVGGTWNNLLSVASLKGDQGVSVPSGGTSGQTLLKNSSTDYDYSWATPPTAPVTSVNTQTGDVVLTQDSVGDGTTYKRYSATDKTKLAGIAAGAEVNVNSDWNAASGDAQILNKPSIPSKTSDLTNDSAFITSAGAPVQSVAGKTGTVTLGATDLTASGISSTKYLRGDNTWQIPTNTTYSSMPVAEGQTGTATTARTLQANYLKSIIDYHVQNALINMNTGVSGGWYKT